MERIRRFEKNQRTWKKQNLKGSKESTLEETEDVAALPTVHRFHRSGSALTWAQASLQPAAEGTGSLGVAEGSLPLFQFLVFMLKEDVSFMSSENLLCSRLSLCWWIYVLGVTPVYFTARGSSVGWAQPCRWNSFHGSLAHRSHSSWASYLFNCGLGVAFQKQQVWHFWKHLVGEYNSKMP